MIFSATFLQEQQIEQGRAIAHAQASNVPSKATLHCCEQWQRVGYLLELAEPLLHKTPNVVMAVGLADWARDARFTEDEALASKLQRIASILPEDVRDDFFQAYETSDDNDLFAR